MRCAAGREVYFKGREGDLLRVVDSIFASGYLTAGGQGIKDTIQAIENAGYTYEIESDDREEYRYTFKQSVFSWDALSMKKGFNQFTYLP